MGDLEDCIFCRVARHEMSSDIVYEDDEILAFRDINPQAPTHVLIIPKRHIHSSLQAVEDDAELLGRLLLVAARLAPSLGVAESGFRMVVNTGPDAGMAVPHLHVHLLGGRKMSWPPG